MLVARGRAETEQYGVIDTVGRDFLDLAVMPEGEDRRPAGVRQVVTIPFAALAAIRSVGPAGS